LDPGEKDAFKSRLSLSGADNIGRVLLELCYTLPAVLLFTAMGFASQADEEGQAATGMGAGSDVFVSLSGVVATNFKKNSKPPWGHM
jgi:hypothetical protein